MTSVPKPGRPIPTPKLVWPILALLAALLVLPVWGLVPQLAEPSDSWPMVKLGKYLWPTLILAAGSGILALLFGVPAAWLTSACRFPGQRIFSWALVLPLALPGYLAVYGYHDAVEKANPLILWMREHWGHEATRNFDERLRLLILIMIFGSVLYPYIYLTTRASFRRQASSVIEASRLLGRGPSATFRRIALPLARPAIVGGAALVLMEVLNDFGTVSFFDVHTFTRGIIRYGVDFDDKAAAARLSLILVSFVVAVLVMEKLARGRARFSEGAAHRPLTPWKLSGLRAWLATLFCLVPLAMGFLIPGWRLLHLAWLGVQGGLPREFWPSLKNTLLLAGGSSIAITLFALLLTYAVRLQRGLPGRAAARAALIGYGMPGAVIALAVTLGLIQFSKSLGIGLLAGTLTGLILAYAVRFLAVAWQPLESGLHRVCGSLDDASRTLGAGPWETLWRINLPLLRGPLLAAGLLTFLDLLKELPITLLLRPSSFSTLATRAWDLNEQNRLTDASIHAVVIALLGAAGALWLHRSVEKG